MAMVMRLVPVEARSRPALETGRPVICQLGGDSMPTAPSSKRSGFDMIDVERIGPA
jgi:hypothetical protein